MNIKIAVVAICLLSLIVMLPGCAIDRPTDADVEEAVLRDIAGEEVYDCQWVTDVGIITYYEPYTAYFLEREYKFWPVRVYFIGDQRREERKVHLYQDMSGEWRAVIYNTLHRFQA